MSAHRILNLPALPDAEALGYLDSTVDVVDHDDRVEFVPDRTRPIGNEAWLSVDHEHLVSDLETVR